MVYPRRDGSRSLVKFVALCAVTSCLFQDVAIAKSHRKQAPAVVNACQSLVLSEGDAAAGISIVSDLSCSAGGLGCIDKTTCRFCKTKDTPKSSHFYECSSIGSTATTVVPVTTPAPVVAVSHVDTGCPYAVSDGDATVGIQLVGDSTCTKGGLGCFADVCRFCQAHTTPQSSHLVKCKDLGVDFGNPTPTPSATPLSAPQPATATVVADPASVPEPASATPATQITVDPTDGTATGCPYPASEGNIAVGIQLVGDATCARGGLGCYKSICRYCKFQETPRSKHLLNCSDFGYPHGTQVPTYAPASIDDPVINPEPVTTTAPVTTPESVSTVEPVSAIVPVANSTVEPLSATIPVATAEPVTTTEPVSVTVPVTTADPVVSVEPATVPVATSEPIGTAEPGTTTVPVSTSAPDNTAQPINIVAPTVAPSTGCPYPVSEGDFAVGIQLVGDTRCAAGGLGCFKDVCRFCQFRKTAQSGHLMVCHDLGYDFVADSGSSSATTDTSVIASSNTATGCPYLVSDGDVTVGIQLVGDPTCVAGGLGCYRDVCRFCKFHETPQSNHLMNCSDFDYPQTEAPSFAPASVADPQPSAPTPNGEPTEAPAPTSGLEPSTAPILTFAPEPSVDDGSSDDVNSTENPGLYDGSNDYDVPEPIPTAAPPAIDTVAPPAVETVAPPAADTVAPPAADTVAPPADATPPVETVSPPAVDTIAPPADITDTPPAVGTVVPPGDETAPPVVYTGAPSTDDTLAPPATETPSYGTGCAFPISDGDYNAGIQLVGDASCVEGGLGCFKDVCRFCQYVKTPQSGHLMTCKSLGYDLGSGSDVSDPPTDATPLPSLDPSTDCPYPISSGDFAVGIQLVGDATCADGGLGCYNGVCRFCKFQETPQSQHLLSCANFGYPHTVTLAPASIPDPVYDSNDGSNTSEPATDAPTTDYRVDPTTDSPSTENPVDPTTDGPSTETPVDLATDSPSTESPMDSTTGSDGSNGPVIDSSTCPLTVTEGDAAVGIQLITDPSCVDGGLGCVADVCRFCKFRDTPESIHLMDCASFSSSEPTTPTVQPATCPFTASEGELYIGVQIITDTTCDISGIGCFHDACRYCRFFDTEKSSHLEDCTSFGYNFTPAPTSAAPHIGDTTAPPATPPPTDIPVTECDQTVSEGDKSSGIDMVTDASCMDGGVGCVADSVCRFCKVVETPVNRHMVWCSQITGVVDTPAPVTVDTPAPTVVAPPVPDTVDTPSPVSVATPAPAIVDAPATTTPNAPSATPCDQTVSEGDASAGIDMTTDATCINGGVGCVAASTCRFCKRWETAASGHLTWCPGVDVSTATVPPVTAVPVVVVPSAPVPDATTSASIDVSTADIVTAPPALSVPTTEAPAPCALVISQGDADQGIALATDPTCINGGLDCLPDSTCRYCKRWDTAASTHLEWCAGYDGYAASSKAPVVDSTPTDTPTDTPAPTIDPSTCSTQVSPGDAEAGVAAIHDEQCLNGGVGCFGGVCRFCQVFETDKSANFLPCGSTVGTIAPLRAAARVRSQTSSSKSPLDNLFKDKAFKWSVVGAACVGVVAVVALFGLGAKRVLTRARSHKSLVQEPAEDTETTVDVPAASSKPEGNDEEVEEVHV